MVDLNPDRRNYYQQRNNELSPYDSCQCTAAIQCLWIIDPSIVHTIGRTGNYAQPEDNLYAYCGTPMMIAYCEQQHGPRWNDTVGYPAEWADVLVKAINDMAGYTCAVFKAAVTVNSIVNELNAGRPVMCSMRYDKVPGHYVSVVGHDIDGLVVDDPYKNHITGSLDGYHCKYTLEQWAAHCKGYGIYFNKRSV